MGTAKLKRLLPYWKQLDRELEHMKDSCETRITELDDISQILSSEKSRNVAILKNCAEIKPRTDNLAKVFAFSNLDFLDHDVIAYKSLESIKAYVFLCTNYNYTGL